MNYRKWTLSLCVLSLLAPWLPIATAFGGYFQISQVTNGGIDDGVVNLFGTYTYDIVLNADPGESILSQQINLRLTSGKIIHHPFGSLTPPSPALIGAFPALAFDTFVAAGSPTSSAANPTVVATSDMLGHPGSTPAIATDTILDVLWGPQLGQDTRGKEDFLSTRFTLSGDADGVLSYMVSFGGGRESIIDFGFCNGFVGFDGCGGPAPLVQDFNYMTTSLSDVVETVIAGVNVDSWSELLDPTYTPGFGAPPNAPGVNIQPSWNSDTQMFRWDTVGSSPGTYTWSVEGSNFIGSDRGLITIQVLVPEPGLMPVIGTLLFAFVGNRLRPGVRR